MQTIKKSKKGIFNGKVYPVDTSPETMEKKELGKSIQKMELTLKESQEIVQKFIEERGWQNPPEDTVLHMLEEMGEVSRNVLKMKNYGGQHTDTSEINMEEELADLFYCLVKLANTTNIDLSKSFMDKMEKNRNRFPSK